MAHFNYEAPLRWPTTLPATPRMRQRADSGFSSTLTLDESLQFLQEEITALDPQRAVLSTDMENIMTPRTRKALGTRSGASLTFKMSHGNYIMACDLWQKLEHNIYALHLTLRQLTNIERWGVANMQEMLHPFLVGEREKIRNTVYVEEEQATDWMRVLGLGTTATLEDAVAVYHRRAKRISQDGEALAELNDAMNEARKHLKNS